MKVITAPTEYTPKYDEISLFLAGEIINCPDWQREVIESLEEFGDFKYKDKLVIYNPRRPDFDTKDSTATDDQIAWEAKYRHIADIFAIYFCKDQIQPICLFELGQECENRHVKNIIVTSDEFYPRLKDIEAQLACVYGMPMVSIGSEYDHADNIIEALYAKWMDNNSSPFGSTRL